MKKILEYKKYQLRIQMERLEGASPLQKLKQGYAYVSSPEGKNIKSIHQTSKGQQLELFVNFFVVDTWNCLPSQSATLSGSQILDSMKTET